MAGQDRIPTPAEVAGQRLAGQIRTVLDLEPHPEPRWYPSADFPDEWQPGDLISGGFVGGGTFTDLPLVEDPTDPGVLLVCDGQIVARTESATHGPALLFVGRVLRPLPEGTLLVVTPDGRHWAKYSDMFLGTRWRCLETGDHLSDTGLLVQYRNEVKPVAPSGVEG